MIKTLMRYLNHYDNIYLISISKLNYFILIQISTQNPAKNVIESQPCLEAVFCDRRIIMFSWTALVTIGESLVYGKVNYML